MLFLLYPKIPSVVSLCITKNAMCNARQTALYVKQVAKEITIHS